MGSDDKSSPAGGRHPDFGFAFNNSNFSDRVLRIEIVANPYEDPPESEICQTLTDRSAAHKSKRRRGDVAEKENEDEAPASRSGDEDGSSVLRVQNFHVNSLPLASNSPFFYKLFSNGMLESKKQCVTLRIDVSEEAALMELLNFMYRGTLRVNIASAVLDVLVVADKFGVASCIRHCCRLLRDMPMSPEFALHCLELPTSILKSEAVKPLMDAANQFLAACYKDVLTHKDEIMKLPLVGIEAILSSNNLEVSSEDEVYDIALKWTEIHYQNSEERRDVLCTLLGRYIRFSYISPQKLRKVLDTMFFKADNPASTSHLFVERAYTCRPIKVVEFELPRQHSVVYLDLKREECARLFPSGRICSQAFILGGHVFFLIAYCLRDHHLFGLFLNVLEEKDSATFAFDYKFCARSKPLEEYIHMCKGNYDFAVENAFRYATGGNPAGYRRSQFLFSIPWTSFVAEDSPYFINGVLQIRGEITLKR